MEVPCLAPTAFNFMVGRPFKTEYYNAGKGGTFLGKTLQRRYIVLILIAASVLAGQGVVFGFEKKMGVYFPEEPGLKEIDHEKIVEIKWLENLTISFIPGNRVLSGDQRLCISSGKKLLFSRKGSFWFFFETEDFPYLKCKSLVVRRMEEGHNSDSFIVLTVFPDKRTSLVEIDGIWDEKSIDLIFSSGPDGSKAIRLRFGSYSPCADRYYYSRAAVFDKQNSTWRLDRRGELPDFYRRLVVEVEAELKKLSGEPAEDIGIRKRFISKLVFEIACYRYMTGEPLDKAAEQILSGFAFNTEEKVCAEAMIKAVRHELKENREEAIAKRYKLDSSFVDERIKAKRLAPIDGKPSMQ